MDNDNNFSSCTWSEWIILTKISVCKNTNPTYKKEWANRINDYDYNPIFIRVIQFLIDNNIATKHHQVGRSILVNIDINKLDKFIETTNIYKNFKEYVHSKELFVIGV